MTDFKKSKSVSSSENVLKFYNKYFATENDERLLLGLIDDLSKIFISKIPYDKAPDILALKDMQLSGLRYQKEDRALLSPFAQDCIQFMDNYSIKLDQETKAVIDSYGNVNKITGTNKSVFAHLIGSNIATYLLENKETQKLNTLENILLQNTLVSKIYQAVRDHIIECFGEIYGDIFSLANENIIAYEEILTSTREENFTVEPLQRLRSRK